MSDFIFTKHALQRLQERSIPVSTAEAVLSKPDYTQPGKKAQTIKFVRTINNRNIQLVGTFLDDQKKWLIISAWVRGEEDKVPLIWTVLSAPFKVTWWIIKKFFKK